MTILALAVLGVAVAAAVVAAVIWGVRSQGRSRELANQIVPGTPTRAPASWAGSHDPEARLHRRLRDAVAALRNATGIHTDTAALELRVELEQHALALDDALVDAAGLPVAARAKPFAQIEAGIERLEAAVAELAARSAADAHSRIEGVAADARSRHEALLSARQEIDLAARAGASPTGSVPSAPHQAPVTAPAAEPPVAPAATQPPATEPPAAATPPAAEPLAATEPPTPATQPPTPQPAPRTDTPGQTDPPQTQPPTPPN